MKNGRTISIKDPKLQRMRNSLRLIILKECSKRQMEISDREYYLTHDKNGNYVRISEETSKILQNLSDKWWEIERPLRASIVKCATCGKHKKDMTYYKKSHTWYCVDCYKKNFS
ncbi:hypothetical protein LCGC14_0957690 [marine sediment metagenome]|uniref:Uncharacterized protein n=1 Tax=marine sediment metagenome TaxID=412755 RepID=A0A0F9QYQ4_9ZZZZ|nr:MAG: hypothetical protein Lokiarch_22680 [Candidatus Lokiarchaeum sp. GC14_75]